MDARRLEFEAAGFNGEQVRARLDEILREDRHLRECCPTAFSLANLLDWAAITPLLLTLQANATHERLDQMLEEFSQITYGQGRFRSIALSHLFNFDAEEPSLRFGNIRVERLDGPVISMILGESSPVSFIHPAGCGNYFLVSEQEGQCDDHITWLFDERNKAERFVEVLQYFKDGVIHIDYAVPHFLPQWVNQIRKFGVFFAGNPRRYPHEAGQRLYRVSRDEVMEVSRWWAAYQLPQVSARIADEQSTMRQAGMRAGDYYSHSHTEEEAVGRLVSLAVALEALFSPEERGEFTFRISQGVSQLVGTTSAERDQLFRDMKEFYNRRSVLVHGRYDVRAYYEGRFVTHEDCDSWASVIRRAILRFLTLYLRGENDRRNVLARLSRAALDSAEADRLREQSDPLRLLNELVPPPAA